MSPRPPRPAEWLLARSLPPGDVGWSIRGDLRQEFEELADGRPAWRAHLWYWRQATRLAARYAAEPFVELWQRRSSRRRRPGRKQSMETLRHDLRFAVRTIVKSPGFALVAVTTLALGIGANTAIFSVVNGVLLRPLDHPDADRLVTIDRMDLGGEGDSGNTTPGNFEDWRRQARSFRAMATYDGRSVALTGLDEARRVRGMFSAGSLLEVLREPPLMGRVPTTADDVAGEHVVVLSHGLWRTAFSGSPDVLGSTIRLGGDPYTIVGVMPEELAFGPFAAGVDLWAPSGWSSDYRANRSNYAHRVVARLADGVTLAEAQREMESIMEGLRETHPEDNRNHGVRVAALRDEIVEEADGMLLLLMGAVGLVLLIGCVNLANLMLGRASARGQEMAVRQALGASRGRLVRQMLTESLLIALLGGIAGLALGTALLDVVVALLPDEVPYLEHVTVDAVVLGFTLAASTAAGIAFGLVPALRFLGGGTRYRLGDAGRVARRTGRTWDALVVAEMALCVVLLVAAGLLLRSFVFLMTVDPGFETEGVLTFQVSLPDSYDAADRIAFFQELREELRALPGVAAATVASQLPATVNRASGWLDHADRPVADRGRDYLIPYRLVLPGHFEALGIPRVRGRTLEERDAAAAPGAVVNEAAAQRFWPDRDPVGQRITLGSLGGDPWVPPLTVVGIVGDVRNSGLGAGPQPTVYLPYALSGGWSTMTVALRTAGEPAGLAAAARARVQDRAPDAIVYAVATVEELHAEQRAPTRSILLILAGFALLGLVLAGVGVFGVLSYSVCRRTREMGIRVALGASSGSLTRMIVGQALVRAGAGLALGLAGALAARRLIASQLHGISPGDPLTAAGVTLVLLTVAMAAAWLPARRAATVQPVRALRTE